jgi:hypothetical protein
MASKWFRTFKKETKGSRWVSTSRREIYDKHVG